MGEPIEPARKHPVERVHQNFHGVLHGIVKGFNRGVLVRLRVFNAALCSSRCAIRSSNNAGTMPFGPRRDGITLYGRGVIPSFLGRVEQGPQSGVADVVADHDGGYMLLKSKTAIHG